MESGHGFFGTVRNTIGHRDQSFFFMRKQKRPNPSEGATSKRHPVLPPGFSSSKAEPPDEVTASLAAIYGKRPNAIRADLAKIDTGRRRTWVAVLFAISVFLATLAGAAWAGFWWWSGRAGGNGLQIAVEGPSRVSIGQETTFFLNWFNRTQDPLASADVRVAFPTDFVITAIDPEPAERAGGGAPSFTSRLGAVPAGGHGVIKVMGIFTGALGTKNVIQIIGTYRVGSSGREAETLLTQELEYAESVLDGALDVPAKVLPGDRVTIVYRITNKGDTDMDGLEARLTLPDGFVPEAAAPSTYARTDTGAIRMPIGLIPAGASSTVRMIGAFAIDTHGDETVHAEAGRIGEGGSFAAAQKTDGIMSVLAGDIDLNITVNGSAQDRSVALGERERIVITYVNTSGEELQDVALRFRLGGETASSSPMLVDWKVLEDSASGTVSGHVVTYTADQIKQLDRLPPNGSGLIELSVPLVKRVSSNQDVPLFASAEAVIGSVGGVSVNRTVTTRPITLRLQTDAALHAIARYASEEGAPVGSGPLPPVAATATTYRIEWNITKTLHALTRVTVSAMLPKNVSFVSTKHVDAGTVSYDADRRLVTWTIDGVPADADETRVAFDVSLIPSQADIGRFADVLGESRFEFTDEAIGESLLRTAEALNTDLPDDALAKGKGVVRKP